MMKKVLALILALVLVAACFAGCAQKEDPAAPTEAAPTTAPTEAEKPDVKLTLWGSEITEYQNALRKLADDFIAANADKANITIELGAESESTAKDTILTDIEAAADVFYFADDQITELVNAGALQPVQDVDVVKAGNTEGTLAAATVNNTLYAYPAIGGNGYFLYYNKNFFSEDDVKSFDKMLEVAAANGKKVAMTMSDGWYNYSFFYGAGFTTALNADGTTSCDWNKAGGTDVLQAMLDIAGSDGFINLADGDIVAGCKDGSVIAGINGSWNSAAIAEAFGDGYACTKLPCFTCGGKEVQMGSFNGFKFVGVNAYSENVGWAMELAKYLTSADSQVYLYETAEAIPANVEAAASDAVLSNPVSAALAAQGAFSVAQSATVGGNYWTPAGSLGQIAVDGNPDKADLQQLLDDAVAGITAPIA